MEEECIEHGAIPAYEVFLRQQPAKNGLNVHIDSFNHFHSSVNELCDAMLTCPEAPTSSHRRSNYPK